MSEKNTLSPEPAYRWMIVAVSPVLLGLGSGALNSLSVFLLLLTGEFGWTRVEATFAYQAGTLCMGVGGLLMGWLADRIPIRRILIFGAVVMGICFVMLSRIHSLIELYVYFCLLNGLGAATLFAPVLANVGNWFTKGQGTAIGLATAGQALGQGLVPYTARMLISAHGWRDAYFFLGIGVMAVAIVLSLLIRTAPSMVAAWAAKRRDEPVNDKGVYPLRPWVVMLWLGAAGIFCCITMSTPMVHLVAMAQDKGIPPNQAALLLLSLFVTALFGRLLYGGFSDRAGPVISYFIASAWQTAMVFGFPRIDSFAWLFVYSAIFALGYSGVMTSLIICVRTLTPLRQRGFAVGFVTMFAWVGMGLGGLQGGFAYDLTGNYSQAFLNAGFAGLVNVVIVAALWIRLRRRTQIAVARLQPA